MFAYGIDFSQSGNKYLLANMVPAVGIDPSGSSGTGLVILSVVQYVNSTQCQAGGYASTCPNNGQLVFLRQIIVGNAAIHASVYGTPVVDATGTVQPGSPSTSGYLNAGSALVQNFPNITLSTGTTGQQYAYISEVYARSPALVWFLPGSNWVNDVAFF
jgi:hypothetical protein